MRKRIKHAVCTAGIIAFLVILVCFFIYSAPGFDRSGSGYPAGKSRVQRTSQPDNSEEPAQRTFQEFFAPTLPGVSRSPVMEMGQTARLEEVLSYWQDEIYTFLPDGVRRDIPMLQLKFYDAGSIPAHVQGLTMGPWADGDRVPPESGELETVTKLKANTFRVGVSPKDSEVYGTVRAGRTYYVLFRLKDNDSDHETAYEALFKVPDGIPRGKMRTIKILAKHRYPNLTMDKPRAASTKKIRGTLDAELFDNTENLEAGYFPSEGEYSRVRVRKDGTFALTAKRLGGMLRITEMKRVATGLIYIHSVEKRKLQLPADADLVIRREDLIPFNLRLPPGVIRNDIMGIALKIERDDEMPMGWVTFGKEQEKLLQNLQKTGTVNLEFVPGMFHVEALYWPQKTGWNQRTFEHLGRLRVRRSDKGKTLVVR